MSDSAPDVVQFGGFELDLRAAELRHEGQVVNLPRQQFIVLTTLVEVPGALVTRDQLRSRLWGDDEYVDFDAGLNFCVRQLRLALGDTADRPRFIQTVPRRGYRFVAPVRVPAAEPPAPSAARVGVLALATLAIVVIGGAVLWSIGRGASLPASSGSDARIADAHAARGFVALNDEWDWDVASRAFDRALQLDPTHEVALISMSRLYASQGRFETALAFAHRATDAHPSSPRARVTLGWVELFAGDAAAARETCAASDQPDTPAARMCRLQAEAATGADLSAAWERVLSELPLDGHRGSFVRATVEARLGRSADALRSLVRAIEAREPDAMFAFVHPALGPLRSEPAFVQATSAAGLRPVDLR